jgi:hypothetical protein
VLDELNKGQVKDEIYKKRSMSYEISSNKLECSCCEKTDISMLPLKELSHSDKYHLCTKCSSALQKKQDYASIKNGTAKLSEKKQNLVEFTCSKGHSWTVNIHRGYKNWCSACIRQAKEEQKKHYRNQRSKVNQENANRQKKLFEDAKTHYLANSQAEASNQLSNFEDLFTPDLPVAKVKAEAYFVQPDASPSCTYEQVLCVYKILELDADRVQFILKGMSADSKKVGFKKLALTLHPDKNRHPLSNEAFLKASELFNSSS